MKICFIAQRRFVYVVQAMALAFKNKWGATQFCGYVDTRPSFDYLKSQKEVEYTKLLLDPEIHARYKDEALDLTYLKKIEDEYGLPNLWPYLEIDRLIRRGLLVKEYPHDQAPYTHEEMMRILQVKIKAIIKFLDEEKPDALVVSVITDLASLFLYRIAQKRNIKVCFIQTSRVDSQYSISENIEGASYIEETFKKIQQGVGSYPELQKKAGEFIRTFYENPYPYRPIDTPKGRSVGNKRQFSFLLPNNILRSLWWNSKIFFDFFFNKHKDDFDVIKPWNQILDKIKRKIRILSAYGGLYEKVDARDNYAYFPLHVEPEMSSDLYAPFYKDQIWLIKQTARSLPINYKLYVREHPAMFGYRARRFYKELKKIPNVKLINPLEPNLNLIKNAKLAITISGSSGWEALLLKKPVICFGNSLYTALPMVKKCRAIEDLPHLIKEQVEKFNYDEKALVDFVTAIYKESVNVDLVQIWMIEGDSQMAKKELAVIPLVNLMAEKLGLIAK